MKTRDYLSQARVSVFLGEYESQIHETFHLFELQVGQALGLAFLLPFSPLFRFLFLVGSVWKTLCFSGLVSRPEISLPERIVQSFLGDVFGDENADSKLGFEFDWSLIDLS